MDQNLEYLDFERSVRYIFGTDTFLNSSRWTPSGYMPQRGFLFTHSSLTPANWTEHQSLLCQQEDREIFQKENSNRDNLNDSNKFYPHSINKSFTNFPNPNFPELNKPKPTSMQIVKKQPSHKGLRLLSLRVKQIVDEEGQTTYKKVAEKLILEMQYQQVDNLQQNVKRRVYDALNVLVAAKVISKENKIISSLNCNKIGKCLCRDKWEEYFRLQKKKEIMVEEVGKKTSKMKELIEDLGYMQRLFLRNKNRGNRVKEEIRLHFPLFIPIFLESNARQEIEKGKQSVSLRSTSQVSILSEHQLIKLIELPISISSRQIKQQ